MNIWFESLNQASATVVSRLFSSLEFGTEKDHYFKPE